jgi:hypothetical protein
MMTTMFGFHFCAPVLPIRHALDVMHIERNISNNVFKHVFGEKDSPAVRRDMEAVGKFLHLYLKPQAGSSDFIQPAAPYVFSSRKREEFMALISRTRVPTGYSSTLIKHASEKRLAGLKSHDHHCLMQQVLPADVRNFLHTGVRETIIKLGYMFQGICSRVIDPNKVKELETSIAETLCLLELNFPPGFFDTMTHLTIHLPTQLVLCGPIHLY